jgi:2-amino-4-hydroxy-6-hydroxymethyldihydropteridine diphosphokinase
MLRKEFSDIKFSGIYKSAPREIEDQPVFLNAVARIKTDDSPETIINKLQAIEKTLKKDPPHKYGPRTIDLDLLLYNEARVNEPRVNVPHPRMHTRRFVLEPLCELIDPNALHPVIKKPWKDLLTQTSDQDCRKINLGL